MRFIIYVGAITLKRVVSLDPLTPERVDQDLGSKCFKRKMFLFFHNFFFNFMMISFLLQSVQKIFEYKFPTHQNC